MYSGACRRPPNPLGSARLMITHDGSQPQRQLDHPGRTLVDLEAQPVTPMEESKKKFPELNQNTEEIAGYVIFIVLAFLMSIGWEMLGAPPTRIAYLFLTPSAILMTAILCPSWRKEFFLASIANKIKYILVLLSSWIAIIVIIVGSISDW